MRITPGAAPHRVAVILPALNEEASLPRVLEALRDLGSVPLLDPASGASAVLGRVVVADNGSTDATARIARQAGATVVSEPRRGYGRACLAGIAALASDPPDIVAFLDADFSDDPARLRDLVAPIAAGECDFVLGSRRLGAAEPGAFPAHQRCGNGLSVALIRLLYGHRFTDLGPFRALRFTALQSLGMKDPTFGWTAEMQVKALRAGLRMREVPVPYRRRIGRSKISGTIRGTVKAGSKILWTIARLRLDRGSPTSDRGRS